MLAHTETRKTGEVNIVFIKQTSVLGLTLVWVRMEHSLRGGTALFFLVIRRVPLYRGTLSTTAQIIIQVYKTNLAATC